MKYTNLAAVSLAAATLGACTSSPPQTYLSTFITSGATQVAGAPDCIVYFDLDSAAIRDDQKDTIDRCARFLAGRPATRLELAGYADERGSKGYNLQLGEQRAKAVQQALAERGLPPERVMVTSYGEARPAAEGPGEPAWGRSRRVEFAQFEDKP